MHTSHFFSEKESCIFFCYYILLSKDLHVSSSFCHWTFWYARDSPLEPDAGVLINLSTFWHHLNLKSRDRGTSLKRCIVYCTGYGIPTYPHVINLSFTIIFWLEAFLTLRHFICPVFIFPRSNGNAQSQEYWFLVYTVLSISSSRFI